VQGWQLAKADGITFNPSGVCISRRDDQSPGYFGETIMKVMTISAMSDVYVDSFLTDEGSNLLFMSVWGRDTAIQEFLARLTIPNHEDGIRDFRISDNETLNRYVCIASSEALDKQSQRIGSDIFHNLTQVWIYDKRVVNPDQRNSRVFQLYTQIQPDPWPLVKAISPVPLLDNWRDITLERFAKLGWCRYISNGIGMNALCVDLGETDLLEMEISNLVKQGLLTLPEQTRQLSLELQQAA
jgi:hypothetical protein